MKKIDEKTLDESLKDSPDEPYEEYDLEISDFSEDGAYLSFEEELDKKVISYIEREVRGSYEYRGYTNYLKNELDLTRCALIPGIDASKMHISLEFHHFPMNLYEITEAVGKKMISELKEGEKVSCFEIAEQITKEHYLNNIGLVPLTKTLHEMAHSQSIIIPISKVNGNYRAFINKYSDYIPDDIKERISVAEINNETDEAAMYNSEKLEKTISRYNITYSEESHDDDDI